MFAFLGGTGVAKKNLPGGVLFFGLHYRMATHLDQLATQLAETDKRADTSELFSFHG